MRKLAITTFAVLYAVLILSASAERSNVWAARQAEALAHSCSGQASHIVCKTEESETLLSQKKLVESQFEVELPREAAAGPTHSEHYTVLASFEFQAAEKRPPVLLSSSST